MKTMMRVICGVGLVAVVALVGMGAMTTNPPGTSSWSGATSPTVATAPMTVLRATGLVLYPTNATFQGGLTAQYGTFSAGSAPVTGIGLIVGSLISGKAFYVHTNGFVKVGGPIDWSTNNAAPADPDTAVGWLMVTNATAGASYRVPVYQ